MSFDQYLADQQSNLDQIRQLPHFTALVAPIHELYDRAVRLVPRSMPVLFGRLLLLSHRNLMSATTIALRGLPDDAAAVTRRAVEAARTALALKHDPGNLQRWIAEDERMARWMTRREGSKPSRFSPKLTYPASHEVCEALGRLFGILSTPRHTSRPSSSVSRAGAWMPTQKPR